MSRQSLGQESGHPATCQCGREDEAERCALVIGADQRLHQTISPLSAGNMSAFITADSIDLMPLYHVVTCISNIQWPVICPLICPEENGKGCGKYGDITRDREVRALPSDLRVFKSATLPVSPHARPQPAHQMGCALQVCAYENLLFHYSSALLFGFPGLWRTWSRMRWGRCSSSSSSPTSSCFDAAKSAIRSTIPRTKSIVA
jgi:hypothetical protein